LSGFDRIIGYDAIKRELRQICDMIHNYAVYEKLGAKLPHGLLFYGEPGLGKTLMAKALIDESGLAAVTIRRSTADDAFIDHIRNSFEEALHSAPAIVFLDDNVRSEDVVQAELERCFFIARDLLIKNRRFLEAAAAELEKKGILLYSDIGRLRGEYARNVRTEMIAGERYDKVCSS